MPPREGGGAVGVVWAANGQGDVMAGFSSRGGFGLLLGIAKPDVSAPGVNIIAGDTPEGSEPTHLDGELFQAQEGTSMSSPHVAGAGALLRQLHPAWTPGQIKSALMTSAAGENLVKEDGVTPFDPFDAGSGRIALGTARAPGLTFDVPVQDYVDHQGDLWTVNYPSVFVPGWVGGVVSMQRTARSELDRDSTWDLTVSSPADLGVTVPAQITVPAGGTASFTIEVDKSEIPGGQVVHASLELKHKTKLVRIPITVTTTPTPNLRATAVSSSSPVTGGGDITLSGTVDNNGTGIAGASVTAFVLSTDATLSGGDIPFAECDVFELGGGQADVCSGTIAFPFGIAPGAYFVLLVADHGGTVAEGNEIDNVIASGAPIIVN